jgi:hypothetical protein
LVIRSSFLSVWLQQDISERELHFDLLKYDLNIIVTFTMAICMIWNKLL